MTAPALPATAAIVLAMGLAAGCAAAGGNSVPAAAGQRAAAPGGPDRSGLPAAPPPPGITGITGISGPGAGAGCASWPSGSTATALLITAGGAGRSYCMRPGQTVTVLLSGPQALAVGSGPPQLTGNALAVTPAQVHPPAMPSVAYTAVRPGTAVLILVGLPCGSLRPAHGAAISSGTECAMRQALRITIIVT